MNACLHLSSHTEMNKDAKCENYFGAQETAVLYQLYLIY